MPGQPPGGTPPPGGGGGGWGTPPPGGGPPGGPPSYGQGFPPPQQPKKSKMGLYVGLGCGCLILMGCLIGGGIWWMIDAMGPGEEVSSIDVTPGQPFTLTYAQDGSQKYMAWLEVDLDHSSSYSLTGPITLSADGNAFGQYTLDEDGSGSPVTERSDSVRISWVHSGSSTSGTTKLFPIPNQIDGSTVTLSGTISAPPGTTGQIRLFVAKRD